LIWWQSLLNKGVKPMPLRYVLSIYNRSTFDISISTDASGKIGIGGCCEIGAFAYDFKDMHKPIQDQSINFKEMLAVLVAIKIFGPQLRNKSVKIMCDNLPVVCILSRKGCKFKEKKLMHLVRMICALTILHEFVWYIEHVAGVDNVLADRIFRGKDLEKVDSFLDDIGFFKLCLL
jgi:hypothetical protein